MTHALYLVFMCQYLCNILSSFNILTDFGLLLLQHLLVQESSIEGLLCGDQFLLDGAILVFQLVDYSVAKRQTPN